MKYQTVNNLKSFKKSLILLTFADKWAIVLQQLFIYNQGVTQPWWYVKEISMISWKKCKLFRVYAKSSKILSFCLENLWFETNTCETNSNFSRMWNWYNFDNLRFNWLHDWLVYTKNHDHFTVKFWIKIVPWRSPLSCSVHWCGVVETSAEYTTLILNVYM